MKIEEIDNDEVTDDDTCDRTELNKIFNQECKQITSKEIDSNKYILHMDGTPTSNPNIILGLSDDTASIYNFSNNQLAKLHMIKGIENIVDVKACKENENLFYFGTKNCQIQLIDLRDKDGGRIYADTTLKGTTDFKPLNTFDISSNGLLLCGGTDVYAGDSYMLFWDIRNVKLLGAYWESHTDDITQVKFHPIDSNKLISGSTDGLINLYNLQEASEGDALIDTFNTNSSIERLCWFNEGNADLINCITHTNEMQMWRLEDSQPYRHYRREEITKHLRRQAEQCSYIADTQTNHNGNFLTLLGSSCKDRECLRGFGFDMNDLVPLFDVDGNNQRVRCSWLNQYGNILITGGESGILDIWNVEINYRSK